MQQLKDFLIPSKEQWDAWKTKTIGFGCDGTNANIAQGGLRGLLSHEMPWVFVFWCLAHRLELSVKGALKPTFFTTVDDLLLRLYYIYEKSPKKCRELEGIVVELKACLEPAEMPRKGEHVPCVRAEHGLLHTKWQPWRG